MRARLFSLDSTALGVRGWSLLLVVGAVAVAGYAAELSPTVDLLSFAVVALASCLALVLGPRLHRPHPRAPWTLLLAACLLFLLGALIRPWAIAQDGLLAAAAEVCTVPGYIVTIAAFALLLRARGSLERHAIADGLIVTLGAGLLSVVLFALPAASVAGRPPWLSAVAALYPVLDIVLVLALVNLAFTTAVHRRSSQLLVMAVVCMLAGDVGYAWIGARGDLLGSRLLDLPYICGYALLGAAALHPSMVDLGRLLPRPVQAWSLRRLAVLLPALATPFVVLVAIPAPSLAVRITVSVTGAAMVAALLLRAVSAVRGHSRAQAVFRHQATHDAVTGLPNRVLLSEEVTRMLTSRRDSVPVHVLFLDLDGFKLVNDSWGHDAGDRLIAVVAGRLRDVAPAQAVVSRIGGDEFILALPAHTEEAVALAEQIIAALAEPFEVGGAELVVTASIGISRATGSGTAEALIRDADTAMYRAKSAGRSRWVLFDSSMRQRVRERVEIELALRHAVARGQLQVAYQPIVDLVSGRWLGAEALLRWSHPVRGNVSPAEFIPVAEETGLIVELGDWVLTEAVRQLARWRRSGVVDEDFFMSVNVSTRQLRDGNVLTTIASTLQDHRVPADVLALEITESVMIDQTEVAGQVLLALRDLGVRLSVDDFGTGYSALGYLRRFPLTGVKIDRQFVDGLGRDADDEEIVRAIVAMTGALSLTVVAEGVETEDQRRVLLGVGVRQAQGWLYGRAMAPSAFAAQLRSVVAAPVRLAVGNA